MILTKFILSNHRLPVEVGRHSGIARNDRLCTKCFENNNIGDEEHYLLHCKYFIQQRRALLGQYLSDTPNIQNIVQLLNQNSYDEISQLSKYINIICKAYYIVHLKVCNWRKTFIKCT